MKATQKQPMPLHRDVFSFDVELDAPWGSLDLTIGYIVEKGDRDHPQLFELRYAVWRESEDIKDCLNFDYILDLCADDYLGRAK